MANLSTKTGLPSFSQSITEINYFPDGGFERGVNGVIPAGWSQFFESDAVTFTDAGDLVAVPSVLPNAGDTVSFTVITGTTGISINTLYYVINPSALSFQLSLTLGGSAIALTTNGTGTMVRGKPKTGSGGVAVPQVTMLVSNSSPIRGTLSAIISKDANNRQGIGFSFPFTISEVDKGFTAVVTWEQLTSLNFVQADILFYVYDVTNSILITPRNIIVPKTDNFGKFVSDYGLTNGTSYRFILHIATPNALAYTLKLDTMVNTTTRASSPGDGPSEWISYNPIWSATGTQPVIGLGSLTGAWRKVGTSMEVRISLIWGTTTTGGSGEWRFSLPNPPTYTAIALTASGNSLVGYAKYLDTGTSVTIHEVELASSTTVRMFSTGTATVWGATSPATWVNGDIGDIFFSAQISQFIGSSANFAQATALEFAWNSTATASSGMYTANKGNGAQGTPVLSYTPTGTGAAEYECDFQTNIQPNDLILLEMDDASSGLRWIETRTTLQQNDAGTTFYGASLRTTGPKTVVVAFHSAPNKLQPWSAYSAYRWRVFKANPLAPSGFGQATADSSGLISRETSASFSATFTAVFASSSTIKYTRNGNLVTLSFPQFRVTATGAGSSTTATAAIPAGYRPFTDNQYAGILSVDNSVVLGSSFARIQTNGDITIYRNATLAGTNWTLTPGGWEAFSFTYSLV